MTKYNVTYLLKVAATNSVSSYYHTFFFLDETSSPDKTMYCIERGSYLDSYNSFRQTLAPVVLIYCGIKSRRNRSLALLISSPSLRSSLHGLWRDFSRSILKFHKAHIHLVYPKNVAESGDELLHCDGAFLAFGF